MKLLYHILVLCFLLGLKTGYSQEVGEVEPESAFLSARALVYEGKHLPARNTLNKILAGNPSNVDARALLAKTHSWDGHYKEARRHFNKITSSERENKDAWLAAIKNELYAKNDAIALGLANKALKYHNNDIDIDFLRSEAMTRIRNKKYPERPKTVAKVKKAAEEKKVLKNTFGVTNTLIGYSDVLDPMFFSSIELKRKTPYGTVIPRLNYSYRLEKHGVQYDLDAYPKISKTFYAYLNYGYSNSTLYPKHKAAADLYANLPGTWEASIGMRYIDVPSKNINIYAGSVGYYRGNYYFSLRSYITPETNNLARISGSLLVRKYLKDAQNYWGISAGMGYAPELRQTVFDGTLLAESLIYLESQRINLEYQFSGKKEPTLYKTRLGVARQELFSAPGNFYWSFLAGFAYRLKF